MVTTPFCVLGLMAMCVIPLLARESAMPVFYVGGIAIVSPLRITCIAFPFFLIVTNAIGHDQYLPPGMDVPIVSGAGFEQQHSQPWQFNVGPLGSSVFTDTAPVKYSGGAGSPFGKIRFWVFRSFHCPPIAVKILIPQI